MYHGPYGDLTRKGTPHLLTISEVRGRVKGQLKAESVHCTVGEVHCTVGEVHCTWGPIARIG